MNHLSKAMEHAAASAEWQSKVSETGYSPDNAHASAQADTHRQQAIMHGLIAIAQALTTPTEAVQAAKRRVHQVYVDLAQEMADAEAVEAWMLKNGCEVEPHA